MANLFDSAMQYIDFGFSIVPVHFKDAVAKWKHFKERQSTKEEIVDIFKRRGRYITGIAVILGPASNGWYCRDFDKREAYFSWAEAFPELAKSSPTVETGKGFHVYFRSTRDFPVIKFDGEGELRGSGGYVVAPPSKHMSGNVYKWLIDLKTGSHEPLDPTLAGFDRRWDGLEGGVTQYTQNTQNTQNTQVIMGNLGVLGITNTSLNESIHIDTVLQDKLSEIVTSHLSSQPNDVTPKNGPLKSVFFELLGQLPVVGFQPAT